MDCFLFQYFLGVYYDPLLSTYYVPGGPARHTVHIVLLKSLWGQYYVWFHSTDDNTEAWRDEASW